MSTAVSPVYFDQGTCLLPCVILPWFCTTGDTVTAFLTDGVDEVIETDEILVVGEVLDLPVSDGVTRVEAGICAQSVATG